MEKSLNKVVSDFHKSMKVFVEKNEIFMNELGLFVCMAMRDFWHV